MSRILLVDDEKAVKWAVQEALKDAGYEVDTANSGEEGLMKAREKPFDLIVSDLRMPGISGLDMLRELKEEQPELRSIICSAYGSMESVVDAIRLGVNDFKVKPFKIAELMKSIEEVLGPPTSAKLAEPGSEAETADTQPMALGEPAPTGPATARMFLELLSPPSLPCQVAGATESGRARPSEGVFLDVTEEDGQHVILFGSCPAIGYSAKVMNQLVRGIFRCQIHHNLQPVAAVQAINEVLWKSVHPKPSVSLFYGVLDTEEKELRYVCTGASVLGGLRYAEKKDLSIRPEKPLLGLYPGVMLKEHTVSLEANDRLVLLSAARTEFLPRLPDVEESFTRYLMPEANWQDSGELARQVQAKAASLGSSQSPSELTVIVVEQARTATVEALRQVTFSSQEQNLQRLLVELGRLGEEANASRDTMHDITTAVIEAVNNAQVHAYPDKEGEISVQMAISNGEIVIEVCDMGVGYDTDKYSPPDLEGYEGLTREGGRGIFIINELMDRVLPESRPGHGTIIHMAKKLGRPTG